ncbi:MAG: ribosome recycling factor [Chloroflexota bacterium]|nr:ribosome recycling factor [Chloroflexota bacterium]
MIQEILTELNSRMQKAVDGFVKELASIRTGRATPSLVDNIVINYHGSFIPLQQLASISTPKADSIIIQPWDRTTLKDIQKAITKANIGLNPQGEGGLIRLPIPPLSEERRNELAKLISRRVEERRVTLRNIRRDEIERLREMEKNKEISQDQFKNTVKEIDELSNSFIDKVNQIGQDKEKEIKEV